MLNSYRANGLASLAAASVVVVAMTLSSSPVAFAAGPGWFNNFEQAVQTARQQGRPIFVDFSTSWCSVCKQMDRTTLADPAVIGRLDNFIKVKVDGDARPDLVNSYQVMAYPTFFHLDANGQVVEKREGFMRVQEMASALDRTWQSVSSSLAIAQANNGQNGRNGANEEAPRADSRQQQEPGQNQQSPQIASAGLNLLEAPRRETTNVSRENNNTGPNGAAPAASLYNMPDPQLQGGQNVYAMGSGPSTDRRSRFGGGAAANDELRQLAEATAQPNSLESSEDNPENSTTESTEDVPAESVSAETPVAEPAIEQADTKAADEKKAAEERQAAEDKARELAEAKARDEADRKALEKRSTEVAAAAPSPVIQSRLSGLPESELPKPLLSRTASGATQAMKPAPTVSTSANTPGKAGDPLRTIRRIQGDDGQPKPAVSEKSQPIVAQVKNDAAAAPSAAAKTEEKPKAPAKAEEKPNDETAAAKPASREIAMAPAPKASTSSASSKKSDSESKSEEKTAKGATRSDIDRWMKDADSKLVNDRKKEARAMYAKVVENDPDNKFGKSDMAYIKMVSLIVDRDSDRLRLEAYAKIKDFEKRFPESEHKDYYTLIRAILAADLGEVNEAHDLLGKYKDDFPDSKYKEIAEQTYKDLPPKKKESSKKSASTSSSSKSKRS